MAAEKLLLEALRKLGGNIAEEGVKRAKTVRSVAMQRATRQNPITEEEARLAVLSRIGEGTDALKTGGGFTIDPRTGKMVNIGEEYGFMMSPIRNENAVQIPMRPDITPEEIMQAIPQEYWPRLQAGGYLGSWVDNGQVYIDPAERYLTKLASLRAGTKSGQLQGANLGAGWDGAGPFYDVTEQAINDELKKRALLALTTAGAATAAGTAGILRQE